MLATSWSVSVRQSRLHTMSVAELEFGTSRSQVGKQGLSDDLRRKITAKTKRHRYEQQRP